MDEQTKTYIDSKFAEVESSKQAQQEQAKEAFDRRKAQVKIVIFVCSLIMLGLLGFMLSILWKYQISPRL